MSASMPTLEGLDVVLEAYSDCSKNVEKFISELERMLYEVEVHKAEILKLKGIGLAVTGYTTVAGVGQVAAANPVTLVTGGITLAAGNIIGGVIKAVGNNKEANKVKEFEGRLKSMADEMSRDQRRFQIILENHSNELLRRIALANDDLNSALGSNFANTKSNYSDGFIAKAINIMKAMMEENKFKYGSAFVFILLQIDNGKYCLPALAALLTNVCPSFANVATLATLMSNVLLIANVIMSVYSLVADIVDYFQYQLADHPLKVKVTENLTKLREVLKDRETILRMMRQESNAGTLNLRR